MKIIKCMLACIAFIFVTACSKSDEKKEPLVNSQNSGHMGEKLKGTFVESQGQALDKANQVQGMLQQQADQQRANIEKSSK